MIAYRCYRIALLLSARAFLILEQRYWRDLHLRCLRGNPETPEACRTPLNLENPYPIKYQRKLSLLHLAA